MSGGFFSAKLGFLDPDGELIEPYDEALTGARKTKKREWSDKVAKQLDDEGLLTEETTLVPHTGKDYYEELFPLIEDTGVSVEIPTEGLYIGERNAWYQERI